MLDRSDHRAIGARMDLFHFQEEAPGSVFWHPRGLRLFRLVEDRVRAWMLRDGFEEVRTPSSCSGSCGSAVATGRPSGRACSSLQKVAVRHHSARLRPSGTLRPELCGTRWRGPPSRDAAPGPPGQPGAVPGHPPRAPWGGASALALSGSVRPGSALPGAGWGGRGLSGPPSGQGSSRGLGRSFPFPWEKNRGGLRTWHPMGAGSRPQGGGPGPAEREGTRWQVPRPAPGGRLGHALQGGEWARVRPRLGPWPIA